MPEPETESLESWQPVIHIDGTGANPRFVQLITGIIDRLPYANTALFPPVHRKLFAFFKAHGLRAVIDVLDRVTDTPMKRDLSLRAFGTHLGEVVIKRMTVAERNEYLRFNDFDIDPTGRCFTAYIRSLATNHLNGQPLIWDDRPCYYSPRRPTVTVNGVGKIVAFSKHCVEQICERACTHWDTYAGLGDAFAFFADCKYFETCEIRGREGTSGPQPAITFFQDCFLDQWMADVYSPPAEYFTQVIGQHPPDVTQHWYYRVGYCPVVIRSEFAIATTLLPPGFTATPEHALIKRSKLPAAEKTALLQQAENNSYENVIKTFDYKLAKWCHHNGIPQVVALPGEVFAARREDLSKLNPP